MSCGEAVCYKETAKFVREVVRKNEVTKELSCTEGDFHCSGQAQVRARLKVCRSAEKLR